MTHPSVAFAHCVENKQNRMYERQAWLFMNTFKHTNPELYHACNHYFIQPTVHNVTQRTKDFLRLESATLIQEPYLSQKQINSGNLTNYTNICVSAEYLSKTLAEEYICWTDLDIIWLASLGNEESFFKHTDKVVVTVFPIIESASKQHSLQALQENTVLDNKDQFNEVYQEYFKPYLPDGFKVDGVPKYVNTWFIYGKTGHSFWTEWRDLTFLLLDIVAEHHQALIQYDLEGYCEEMAASILYLLDPTRFELLEDFFGKIFVMTESDHMDFDYFTTDKVLYHYSALCPKPYPIIDEDKNHSEIVIWFFMELQRKGYMDYKLCMQMAKTYAAGNK